MSLNESVIVGFREHVIPDFPMRMCKQRNNFRRNKFWDRAKFRTNKCSDKLSFENLSRRKFLDLMYMKLSQN